MVWNGFVFLTLSADPGPLTPDPGLDALANWRMDALQTGHRHSRDLACNWKVFWENYNECLHCPGIHPELCDMVPIYAQGIMSAPEAADHDPANAAAEVAAFARIVLEQDGDAVEMNQRGIRLPSYTRGRLMPQEFDIHRFHTWVLSGMEASP